MQLLFEWIYSISASTMMFGLLIGFMVMGDLMDRFGRRETAVVLRCSLGIIASGAMVLSYTAGRFEFFVLGHFLGGLIAALKVVLLIYLAECSPDDKRGFTSMVVNSGGVIMVLIVTPICLPSLVGSDGLWFVLPMICGLMALLHLLIAVNFPDSPKHLYIQKHREVEARTALRFYYGNHYDIDETIEEMETERTYESHETVSLKDIMRHGTYRYCFFLVLLCAFAPTLSALNMKLQYLLSWLISYGLTQAEATTTMTLISLVSAPLCFLAPWVIELFGRRKLFITVTALCALEWTGFGLAQLLTDQKPHQETTSAWVYAVVGATLGQCAVNLGLLIMAPVMISEICPHNTRATISQLTQAVPAAAGMVEVMIFSTLRSTFGAGTFFLLAVCCAVLSATLFKQMPDTAGMPVDDIVRRIHRVRSRVNTATSERGTYGATVREAPSFVSTHHSSA